MGFGVWGLGFGVWGLGVGVWGLGFGGFMRAQGLRALADQVISVIDEGIEGQLWC